MEEGPFTVMSSCGPSRTQRDLRFRSAVEVLSGLDMLSQRFSGSDPTRTFRFDFPFGVMEFLARWPTPP